MFEKALLIVIKLVVPNYIFLEAQKQESNQSRRKKSAQWSNTLWSVNNRCWHFRKSWSDWIFNPQRVQSIGAKGKACVRTITLSVPYSLKPEATLVHFSGWDRIKQTRWKSTICHQHSDLIFRFLKMLVNIYEWTFPVLTWDL